MKNSHLKEAKYLIERWRSLPQLDIIFEDYRQKSAYSHTEQVIFLVKDYFRYSAQNSKLIAKVHNKSIQNHLRVIIDLSIIRFLYHHSMPIEMIVNSAVEYVKQTFNKYEAGFVNQLLRKLTYLRQKTIPPSTNFFPNKLKRYWQKNYNNEENLKLAEVLAILPINFIATKELIEDEALGEPQKFQWAKNYHFHPIINFQQWKKSSKFKDFYIQDPATFSSVNLLDPQLNEKIADLCAAPGGKSRLISQAIGEKGFLTCVELSVQRAQRLKNNLQNFHNLEVIVGDSTKIKDKQFDAILLDVPCSNTGIFRRKPDAMWNFSLIKVQELVNIQKHLLYHSASLVKKNGRIVYSTCSIDKQENHQQVENFLVDFPNFKLEEQRLIFPTSKNDGVYAALLRCIG